MEKQFVTYEIALRLKILGFNEPCLAWFMPNRLIYNRPCPKSEKNLNSDMYNTTVCSAPLWQQVIDWLEEKCIVIEILPKEDNKYSVACYKKNMTSEEVYEFFLNSEVSMWEKYYTKYEARTQAILKAIELWKNK